IHRYLPIKNMVIRLHKEDSLFEILARIAASTISGCDTVVSIPKGLGSKTIVFLLSKEGKELTRKSKIVYQSDDQLIEKMPEIQRIRYAAPDRVPDKVLRTAAETGFYISSIKVMMEGRIELLQYFQNQSICDNYHRYGNLGDRAFDQSVNLEKM
ncbi:aldehyde dehydrogenase, partial [bacterium]|nr:aldehyde dehydrogenase [bacterium]